MASKDIDTTLDTAVVAAAAELSVFDARGHPIRFGALFELEKTIVVFIRHFFCGRCQDYVSQLTTVRSEALEEAGTKIIIIGCGDWLLINNYRELTCATPHPLISYYADPTRNLYRALRMTAETLATTPKDARRRGYIEMGKFANAVRSVMENRETFHNWAENLFWAPHTEDHADVPELFEKAGVAYP